MTVPTARLDAALAALRADLGDRLSTDPEVLASHGRDHSWHPPAPPDAVCFPASTSDVVRVVRACAAQRVPMVPFGAGTSVEGHVLATHGGVAVDLGRMSRILAVHEQDLDAVVEAGVTRLQLARHLDGRALFFATDPGADATLGGMASTRASGTNAVGYGTMRDNVLALEVVLADGRVIRTGSRARKSSAGYDLTRLFVGAEGTLGIITELTVRLARRPAAIAAATVAFPDLRSAVETVIQTLERGVPMARIELLDALMIDAVNRHAGLDLAVQPTLFLEFHGSDEPAVTARAATVAAIAEAAGGTAFRRATDPAARDRLWQARHQAYFAALALRPGCRAWSTDVCVPISRLAACLEQSLEDVARSGLTAPLVGHVGDGNFHLLLLLDAGDAEQQAAAAALNQRVVSRALDMGGTSTGEHGVGIGKRGFLRAEHGEAVAVMAAIKNALDPHGLMNPGKVLP